MPLRKGNKARGRKNVGRNISTLVKDFKKSGRIGTSKPKGKAAAVRQAVAISLKLAGKSRKKK